MAPPADLSALLDEAEWARSLARSLVGDASEADDLVQETLTRALVSRPTSVARPRAWIGTVLRRLHLERRREEYRRDRRERAVARDEAVASSLDLVARAELQRDLAAAVLELPVRERDALLLRHFEGLSFTVMAERLGVSRSVVHERVEAGHARLRQRFARERGTALALLALPRVASPALSTTFSLAPLLLMSLQKLVLIALVLALPLAIWLGRERPSGESDVAPAGEEVAEGTELEPVADGARTELAEAATAVDEEEAVQQTAEESAVPVPSGAILGVVFGPDGGTVEGREVSLVSMSGHGTVRATSGLGGEFEARELLPGTWALVSMPTEEELARHGLDGPPMLHAVQARVELAEGATEHVDLGAPSATEVEVTGVVRTADGEPRSAILQWLPEGDDPASGQVFPRAKEDGRYSATLSGPGRWRVGVTAGNARTELFVEVPPEAAFQHDLLLPGGEIVARFVDEAGEPVVGASVTLHTESGAARLAPPLRLGRATRTDEEGRVRFMALSPGTYALACTGREAADGVAPLAAVRVDGIAAGSEGGERLVVLAPGAALTGRVVDADGAPVRGAVVFVRDEDGVALNPTSNARTDEDGRFTTPPLATGVVSLQAWAGTAASVPTATFVAGPGAPSEPPPPTELALAPAFTLRASITGLDPATTVLSLRDAAGLEHAGLLDGRRPWDWLGGGQRVDVLRVGPLPPGRYDLVARDAAGEVRRARAVVLVADVAVKM